MPSAEHFADTVNRYISLIAKGSADDLVDLYADDATVEDPVGGEVHIGRQAIHAFYAGLASADNVERECELVTLRVAGHEAELLSCGPTISQRIAVLPVTQPDEARPL
jgi:steroid delta-isomerase